MNRAVEMWDSSTAKRFPSVCNKSFVILNGAFMLYLKDKYLKNKKKLQNYITKQIVTYIN